MNIVQKQSPQKLLRILRRIKYQRRTSEPFISGDFFASIADYRIYEVQDIFDLLEEKVAPEIIFCKSELVDELTSHLPITFKSAILLAGNSDFEFTEAASIPWQNFRFFFLQNSFISDDKRLFTLPIGVENLRLATNGLPQLLRSAIPWERKKNKILVGPFSPTHHERDLLIDAIQNLNFVTYLHQRETPMKLSTIQQEYKFVACPRGNGVDTHRIWEVLYRGSIPIVKKSDWSSSLSELKLPLIEVRDWNEKELIAILENQFIIGFAPEKIPALWAPFWNNRLDEMLRKFHA